MNAQPQKHAGKIIGLILVLSMLAVYWQVEGFEFTNFDDPDYVTENRQVKNGLTLQGITWAFQEFHVSNWHPVTWMSHMLDVELFGLDPGMHHMTNVFFHVVNSLLLFYLLRSMTGSTGRSAFVSALFALHPLHVESVAWIAERKDVLSTFFWMLAIIFYVRYTKFPNASRYFLVFAAFAVGLMCKPMVITLPFVLLLLDYWPLARPGSQILHGLPVRSFTQTRSLVLEKIPLLVLVAISGVVTFIAQQSGGAVISTDSINLGVRLANALVSYTIYIFKMFMPLSLAPHYPYSDLHSWQPIGAGLALGAMTFYVIKMSRKAPYLLVGWLWFLGTLVPVIGLVQVGSQAMADRYTYIPSIGLSIMFAWGAWDVLRKLSLDRRVAAGSAAAVCAAMIVMSWNQTSHWKNSSTLWEHALAVTDGNSKAYNNYGRALEESGQTQKAITQYQAALTIQPYADAVHINLANALDKLGQTRRAMKHYQAAIEIDPESEIAHNNLGLALEKLGSANSAITHFQRAIEIEPEFAEAHHNLGVSYFRAGQLNLSIRHLQKAVEINPDYTIARENLQKALKVLDQQKNL